MVRYRTLHHIPVALPQVWDALHRADVLRRIVPGCRELIEAVAGVFEAVVGLRVGPLGGAYRCTAVVVDGVRHEQLSMRLKIASRHSQGEATCTVVLGAVADGTALSVRVDARAGGLLGRVGRAVLTQTGRRLNQQFAEALTRELGEEAGRRLSDDARKSSRSV